MQCRHRRKSAPGYLAVKVGRWNVVNAGMDSELPFITDDLLHELCVAIATFDAIGRANPADDAVRQCAELREEAAMLLAAFGDRSL